MSKESLERRVEELEKRYREQKLLLMSRLKLLYEMLQEDLIEGFEREWESYGGQIRLDEQIRKFLRTYEELNMQKAYLKTYLTGQEATRG